MARLPPQPPHNPDHAAASILEPEVPAGGISLDVTIIEPLHVRPRLVGEIVNHAGGCLDKCPARGIPGHEPMLAVLLLCAGDSADLAERIRYALPEFGFERVIDAVRVHVPNPGFICLAQPRLAETRTGGS